MMFGPVTVTMTGGGEMDVGFWTVRRLTSLENRLMPDDEVHEYEWIVSAKKRSGGTEQYTGVLNHRYGDGWLCLMNKVMAAARAEEVIGGSQPAGTGRESNLDVSPGHDS